jgi:hypothetical protein
MSRQQKTTKPELWQCPACKGWYPTTSSDEDTAATAVCESCYDEAQHAVLGAAAAVVDKEPSGNAKNAYLSLLLKQMELTFAELQLPPWPPDYALKLVSILEKIVAAIWSTHGDAIADLQACLGLETPMPPDAVWVSTTGENDSESNNDIDF